MDIQLNKEQIREELVTALSQYLYYLDGSTTEKERQRYKASEEKDIM